MNLLAASLAQTAERKCITFGLKAGFLFKLSERRFERIFTAPNFPFGHRPSTIILVPPVGAARVCEKHL